MLFLPGPGVGQMNSPIVHCESIDRGPTQSTATLQTLRITSGKNGQGQCMISLIQALVNPFPTVLSFSLMVNMIEWGCIESVLLKLLLHQRHSGWGVEGREKPCMEILHYLKLWSPV